MSPPVEQLLAVVVGALVVWLPGGAIVAILGWHRWLSPYLLPAAASTVGLLPLSLFTAVALFVERPIAWVVTAQSAIAIAALAIWIARGGRSGSLTAWVATVHPAVWALALVSGAVAFIAGGALRGDALYHAGLALKLAELDHPSLASTSQFRTGGMNPGYWLPAWHETIAIASTLSGASVATVTWVLPSVLTVCIVLTAAGLAHTTLRSTLAAVVGAAVYVASQIVMTAPQFIPAAQAAYPRTVVTEIVLPLAIACWFASLWSVRREARRTTLLLMLAATVVTLALHSNYVLYLGLGIAGYLLIWALRSPWTLAIARRHAGRSAILLFTAIGGVATLVPVLAQNDRFARGTSGDATRVVFEQWGRILVGTPGHYHLRADYLVWYGGLALLGLACVPLALPVVRREPVAWYLVGATVLVGAISQSDTLFPLLVGSGNASQFVRLHLALPVVLALTTGLLLLGRGLDGVWSRSRPPAIALTAAATGLIAWLAHALPMRGESERPSIPQWPVQLVLLVLAVAVVVLALGCALRIRRRRGTPIATDTAFLTLDAQHAPAIDVGRAGTTLIAAVLLLGTLPATVPAALDLERAIEGRPTRAERLVGIRPTPFRSRFGLRHAVVAPVKPGFDRPIVAALRRLPEGAVVAARLEDSYELMAIAPVYVIASEPGHVATTSANHPIARVRTLNRLTNPTVTDTERLALLRSERADVLLTPAWHGASLREFADRRLNLVATGRTLRLYAIR